MKEDLSLLRGQLTFFSILRMARLLIDCRKGSEDKSYIGRAIYLHIVENLKAERFYVGQARNFHDRMDNHMSFRYRRNKPSLHYYALQRSEKDYYVTLSYVPDTNSCKFLGIQHPGLFLDLLETWCCLMLGALPKKYLEEFFPKDIQIPNKTYENLNLKLPLQESGLNWPEIRDILLESSDPLYHGWYFDEAQRYHQRKQELIGYWKSGPEICKNLDRITIPGSTASLPSLPSPPSSTFKPALRRFQPEAAKQIQPSTPSSTKSKVIPNLLMGDTSLDSGPASVEASNMYKSEQIKRKKESEETPSKLPGSRPAKMICTNRKSSTVDTVRQTLDFNVAEPKEIAMEAIHDKFSDLDDLSDRDSDLDEDIS
jgi:hypothetical protein